MIEEFRTFLGNVHRSSTLYTFSSISTNRRYHGTTYTNASQAFNALDCLYDPFIYSYRASGVSHYSWQALSNWLSHLRPFLAYTVHTGANILNRIKSVSCTAGPTRSYATLPLVLWRLGRGRGPNQGKLLTPAPL